MSPYLAAVATVLFVLLAISLADVPTEGPWQAGFTLALVTDTCQLCGRSGQWVGATLTLGVCPMVSYYWGPFTRRAAVKNGSWSGVPNPATSSGAH